ncbi:MAG: division/cell wall cluster transcriptional repressor MraZ, partial [Paludibacteraceae bacterium]|nr:division/cell wall cluster transcriptional repressor MraZ [Paludibacteraceae bacterium]
ETDNQGRILIQQKDLESSGAGQDIVFVGLFDRFALWSPGKFE